VHLVGYFRNSIMLLDRLN